MLLRVFLLLLIILGAQAEEELARSILEIVEREEANETEKTITVLEAAVNAGDGVGFCYYAVTNDTNVTVTIEALEKKPTSFRVRSAREHLYAAAFALDKRRDLISFESSVKLRTGKKLTAIFENLPLESTIHVLVSCNAIDEGGSSYRVTLESSDPLEKGVSDGCGWRGSRLVPTAPKATLPKRILCIDGGGARGVVPLTILRQAENMVQKKNGLRVRERFDFFAGTSTGAVVAAAMAIAELPIPCVDRLYFDLARLIFGSKGLSSSQRATRFEAILCAVFGKDARLGRTYTNQRRVLFVATDATTSRLRPFVFRNYEKETHLLDNDDDSSSDKQAPRVVDALLASAAAPPYFPSRENVRSLKLLDGALIANNPTLVAVLEAAALGADEPESIVSLGTGVAPTKAARRGSLVLSSFDLLQGVMNLLTDTDAAHDLVETYLDGARRNRDSSTRYHRLDVVVDSSHLDLAEGDSLKLTDLRHLALDYVRREKPYHWKSLIAELDGKRRRSHTDNIFDIDVEDAQIMTRSDLASKKHKKIYDLETYDDKKKDSWLRPLRKTAAKATGMHGFFSGKPTNLITNK